MGIVLICIAVIAIGNYAYNTHGFNPVKEGMNGEIPNELVTK